GLEQAIAVLREHRQRHSLLRGRLARTISSGSSLTARNKKSHAVAGVDERSAERHSCTRHDLACRSGVSRPEFRRRGSELSARPHGHEQYEPCLEAACHSAALRSRAGYHAKRWVHWRVHWTIVVRRMTPFQGDRWQFDSASGHQDNIPTLCPEKLEI